MPDSVSVPSHILSKSASNPSFPIPLVASTSAFLILRLSSTPILSTPASKPTYCIFDVFPGKAVEEVEDNDNQRYVTVAMLREGGFSQKWNIKIEYRKIASEDVCIMNWEDTPQKAGEKLIAGVDAHVDTVAPAEVTPSYTNAPDYHVKSCTYTLRSPSSTKYHWEIVEVKLKPVKQYGISDNPTSEYERARKEDMDEKVKEGLERARISRDDLTEEETAIREKQSLWHQEVRKMNEDLGEGEKGERDWC